MSEWAKEFPYLPNWATFICRLSSSPQRYKDLLPSPIIESDRLEYTRALYWLLAHDLIIQVHEYVRVVATRSTKQKAIADLASERRAKHFRLEQPNGGPNISTGLAGTARNDTEDTDDTAEVELDAHPDDKDFLDDLKDSIIERPGKASPAQSRCLKIIIKDKDENARKRFAMCMAYFDGKYTLEEIQYHSRLDRRDIRRVLKDFKEDLIVFLHP